MSKAHILALNILAAVVLLFAGAYYVKTSQTEAAHVHIHAGFQVYVDGVQQDFSDFQYMSFAPCSTGEQKKLTPEERQIEKAHLHDSVGDVVHVHRKGATWGDLLKNIGFNYDASKELVGYTSDQVIPNILSQPINNHESVIIVIGDQSNASQHLANKVTVERIAQVEQMSELCGATDH